MKNLLLINLMLFISFLFACELDSPEPGEDPVPPAEENDFPLISTAVYGDHPLQNYRLYLPENHDSQTEVVVMVHGGGWVMGYEPMDSVSTFTGRYNWDILQPLLEEGYACVVMKYRTACYNTVAENFSNNTTYYLDRMTTDIDLVIDDLKERSSEIGIGDQKFHLLGESAGGHIVLSYGNRADSDETVVSITSMFGPTYLDAQDFKTFINGLPLALVEPPNYFLKASDNCESVSFKQVRVLSSLKSFSDHQEIAITTPNAFLDTLSPSSSFNMQRNIPMFIQQGELDELVPANQATTMYDALLDKWGSDPCDDSDFGCQHKLKIYEDCGHGWTSGNCQRTQIMTDIQTWIKSH